MRGTHVFVLQFELNRRIMQLDLNKLRALANQKKIIWKRHALERMLERGLSRAIVLQVIANSELIEDYSEDRPSPSGLLLGWDGKRPVHIVTTLEEDVIGVITVYEPTTEYFEPDFRTRRK
jgi:hypothetical protein